MNKLLKVFFVFLLFFGMIFGVFGADKNLRSCSDTSIKEDSPKGLCQYEGSLYSFTPKETNCFFFCSSAFFNPIKDNGNIDDKIKINWGSKPVGNQLGTKEFSVDNEKIVLKKNENIKLTFAGEVRYSILDKKKSRSEVTKPTRSEDPKPPENKKLRQTLEEASKGKVGNFEYNGEKYNIDSKRNIKKWFVDSYGGKYLVNINARGETITEANKKDIKNAYEFFSKQIKKHGDGYFFDEKGQSKSDIIAYRLATKSSKRLILNLYENLDTESLLYLAKKFPSNEINPIVINELELKIKNDEIKDISLKKSLLELGDTKINKEIFKTAEKNEINDLCNKNIDSCLNNMNKKNYKNLDSSEEGQKILDKITLDNIKACMSNPDCDISADLIKVHDKKECSSGFSSYLGSLCERVTGINEKEVVKTQFYEEIKKINLNQQNELRNLEKQKKDCKNGECKNIQKKIDDLKAGSMKSYNSKLLEKTFQSDKFKGISGCSSSMTKDCLDAVNKVNCEDDSKCKQDKDRAKIAFEQTKVETNAMYDIINILANPDKDALNAAKLFGFEPDYSNVPRMLKDSVASQICSAKVDGYLDKDRNDNGGVTSYGCTDVYGQDYDPNLGYQVTTGDPNCVNVLVDLRAQRTQITPDNKVAITYSLYLRASQKDSLDYFLAISYQLKDGTSKKQLLKPQQNFTTIGIGGTKNEYDTINLPLNISRELILDTPNSFKIGVLALNKATRGVYKQKSTIITLFSNTDFYKGISNNKNIVTDNPYKETPNSLTSTSMVDLINI